MASVLQTELAGAGEYPYSIQYAGGNSERYGDGDPSFTFVVPGKAFWDRLYSKGPFAIARAYINGEIDIDGDFAAAVRTCMRWSASRWNGMLLSLLARLDRSKVKALLSNRRMATRQVSFHYDRSNEFYQQFLDPRMVYTCAYFPTGNESLEAAQEAKLNHICRKLDLGPSDRLLDIGCGWGGLLVYAAEEYGAEALGCTLSQQQAELAQRVVKQRHLNGRVSIRESDYRDLTGSYSKIASIGMFEQVGPALLNTYFRKIHALLDDDGLFLNHGIVRPQTSVDNGETLFVQRHVFPGGGLVTLSDVIRAAELAGLEVLDVENLRPHYARTCRLWTSRLQANASACRKLVDEVTYRTWLLYLSASAVNFEAGNIEIHQALLAKRGTHAHRRLTREYMYPARRR